jgi:hypothetical protein
MTPLDFTVAQPFKAALFTVAQPFKAALFTVTVAQPFRAARAIGRPDGLRYRCQVR